MDILIPKKKRTYVAAFRYYLKLFSTKRVRILRTITMPLWFLMIIILAGFAFFFSELQDAVFGISLVSVSRSDISNTGYINTNYYASKNYKEKFDLKKTSGKIKSRWVGNSEVDEPFQIGCVEPMIEEDQEKANAVLVVLARNSELDGVIESMSTLERHFNQWFNYPWVFLNDEEFTDEFKESVKEYTNSKVEFGLVEPELWEFPLTTEDVDPKKWKNTVFNDAEFKEYIERQGDRGIMYGNMASYHQMCRFYSGGFYRHPLVAKYEWYWRVEPEVEFYCDLTYDPFLEMEKHGKKYGFTVMIEELPDTIPNLFRYTQSFIREFNIKVEDTWNLFTKPINSFNFKNLKDEKLHEELKNVMERETLIDILERETEMQHFIRNPDAYSKKMKSKLTEALTSKSLPKKDIDEIKNNIPLEYFEGEAYNYCHFWSNFEIARIDVWDNPKYEQYFSYLEQSGGFFKERWGDAPVHSLGAAMFLKLSELHYFRDIGYKHSTISHCPYNSFDNQIGYLPLKNYFKYGDNKRIKDEDHDWLEIDKPKKNGIGCRCRCPRKQREIEDTGGSCINQWITAITDASNRKFNTFDNKYAKKLDVEEMRSLIAEDYRLTYALEKGKIGSKNFVSSASSALRTVKREEEYEGVKLSDDEFDARLLKETKRLVKEKKVEVDESKAFDEILN